MKLACYRRLHAKCGRGLWLLLLALGLLALCMTLSSCMKSKDDDHPVAHITTQPAQSIPGRAMQTAMGVQCKNNLDQLRMLIGTAKSENENGSYPPSLDSIPEASRIMSCPISHQPYVYDPMTGQVHCTFPGHEKY